MEVIFKYNSSVFYVNIFCFSAMESMETWDIGKTTAWFCKIGLDKYGTICQKEDINGRALLLMGCKRLDQLVSVFQLKKGPQRILMKHLQPYLDAFNQDKPQTAYRSKEISAWTVEELCNWLGELGFPENCLMEVENEEINGEAFLLYKESGELKECLKLKVGTWIVLEHELFLHLGKSVDREPDTTTTIATTKNTQPVPIISPHVDQSKEENECKEPLAASDPSIKGVMEPPPEVALSKEEERLSLLQNALQLDIGACSRSKDAKECVIRSMFVKRGKGANALEKLFNFVVVTKDEMTGDKPRKLWGKIRQKTKDWIKLLPAKDSQSFSWDRESAETVVYGPSSEEVSLRDGKVGQIFLDKLSDDEFKQSLFIVLVDKQLLDEKKTLVYNFSFDSKRKRLYNCKLNVKDCKYHASFDTNSPGQDLKWSKHFRSLMNSTDDSKNTLSDPLPNELQPSLTHDVPPLQKPRPFSSESDGQHYNKGFILDCWETGAKDLIKPAHEFKLFRTGVNNPEDNSIKKFAFETLRFACGCLNERTNGTIHFGVADEVEGQTLGYQAREIVGSCVTNKPRYSDKLKEFVGKCFVGDSKGIVLNCIRTPVFIPVISRDPDSGAKLVIEVDIEPSYSLCAGEYFLAKFKGLDRGREEATVYVRRGSQTQAIVNVAEVASYIKNRLPKLDEERKKREQQSSGEKQDSVKHLYGKLKRLLCANKTVLDSSKYPILVVSKPDASMNQDFLDKTFRFTQNINWQVIVDFDDKGSDSNGLCKVFKCGPNSPQCDIHEAEDYDEDNDLVESLDYKTHWIFGNGYAKLGKVAVGFKQWNNSKRKRGLSQVIQALAKKLPVARAVVLFLLFSAECETMADTFKDFCTYLDGPNQLVYVAENNGIVTDWEAKLLNTCLEEHELRERGVVGMSWIEFQQCVQQIVSGIDRHLRYVSMATGSCYSLNLSFNNIDVVSAKECEELRDLSHDECCQLSSKVEITFYRGYPVTWKNFWFTDDAHMNHVLRRDNYSQLKSLIEDLHSQGSKGKVQTITIYHHIGAGASTMSRQALWDFRCNPRFPYRCAVVSKIDDNACKELLLLRKVGYEEGCDLRIPPVLALVEDTDDSLFQDLRLQVVALANKLPRSEWPVCVFLYCKDTQKPYDCHSEEKGTSVFLEQQLTDGEVDWFKRKYTDMIGKFHNKDPLSDFETYANDNLISFMIMKENFNPKYVSSIVERNLSQVTDDELTLLEYTSLLNIYNPHPVFVSCFDTIMLSTSLLRKRLFRDWVEDLTHSARIFLREVDVSTHLGTGKTIAVVHPIIANELLDKIAERKQTTVSQIALDFLNSPLLENQGKSFTLTYLYDGANKMLKHRKKYEYGDDIQTKFSPLIEKILYVKDAKEGKAKATEKSIEQAAEVLRKGLDKFKDDPMLAQQMARVFYVNAAAFSESTVDSCFAKALEFCEVAIQMRPHNTFLFDTKGRIYESKIKLLYGTIRREHRLIEVSKATPVLPLAFEAFKWFQKSLAASAECKNNSGIYGELNVMFYLLDVLRCVRIFRGPEGLKKLQGYLAYCQTIPPEVQKPWGEYNEPLKDLRNRFSYCMERLTEDFAIYKANTLHEKRIPKQIASFQAQYHSYFGEDEVKWSNDSPEERWEYRWYKINQYLAGGIFSSVFSLPCSEWTQRETLQELKKLAFANHGEPLKEHHNDLLLIIATGMALHSPYGKSTKSKLAQSAEEYKDLYKFVDKLFALEECDEGHIRLNAHLLKVMFLWPREDLELSNYCVQDFYDSLKKLKDRWVRKSKEHHDTDKMQKQKVYKFMTFQRQKSQYTTLFYLGKGSGLDVFVHINELTRIGSLEWDNPITKDRLRRLTGVVESKNIIRVQNPLESTRTIDVYYSSREGGFSKEEVSFYLGFSWANLTAFDVKYTNKDHKKHSVEPIDTVSGDQLKFVPKPYVVRTYEEYSRRLRKLRRTLEEINILRKRKEDGQQLDENQVSIIVFLFFVK